MRQTRSWQLTAFGIERLELRAGPMPEPGAGEVRLAVRAFSLNYRDLLVVRGQYNPRLALPAVPVSDAAGVVDAVGPGVDGVAAGDRVMTHFVSAWLDGPFRGDYLRSTLGTPAAGVAAEHVVLPATAVLPIPAAMTDAAASTLPIAALTAWSALVTDGGLQRGGTALTLGTGGVSAFAIQLGAALGARVLVTSRSDAKLERARALGADAGINYRTHPEWSREVLALTDGTGVDVVVETGGVGTLPQSLRAVRPGGTISLLGALTGMRGDVDVAPLIMRRVRLQGIMVNHRAAFADLVQFVADRRIEPVVSAVYPFEQLPDALRALAGGEHFGKLVIEL